MGITIPIYEREERDIIFFNTVIFLFNQLTLYVDKCMGLLIFLSKLFISIITILLKQSVPRWNISSWVKSHDVVEPIPFDFVIPGRLDIFQQVCSCLCAWQLFDWVR